MTAEQVSPRSVRRWIAGLAAGLALVITAGVLASHAVGLLWYPWELRQRTAMIRASNSYVTTQQVALRQLRAAYDDAGTDGQRLAIVRQMREIADLVPDDTQPDVRVFLGRH